MCTEKFARSLLLLVREFAVEGRERRLDRAQAFEPSSKPALLGIEARRQRLRSCGRGRHCRTDCSKLLRVHSKRIREGIPRIGLSVSDFELGAQESNPPL